MTNEKREWVTEGDTVEAVSTLKLGALTLRVKPRIVQMVSDAGPGSRSLAEMIAEWTVELTVPQIGGHGVIATIASGTVRDSRPFRNDSATLARDAAATAADEWMMLHLGAMMTVRVELAFDTFQEKLDELRRNALTVEDDRREAVEFRREQREIRHTLEALQHWVSEVRPTFLPSKGAE